MTRRIDYVSDFEILDGMHEYDDRCDHNVNRHASSKAYLRVNNVLFLNVFAERACFSLSRQPEIRSNDTHLENPYEH
jgi:hypothetical protein